MSAKRVEYHEGAIADVKSAAAKRPWTSSKNYIEPPTPFAKLRTAGQLGKTTPGGSCSGTFPFAVIYSENETAIIIWAVANGSRRPEYWEHRRLKPGNILRQLMGEEMITHLGLEYYD
jgi:hypothetical protein